MKKDLVILVQQNFATTKLMNAAEIERFLKAILENTVFSVRKIPDFTEPIEYFSLLRDMAETVYKSNSRTTAEGKISKFIVINSENAIESAKGAAVGTWVVMYNLKQRFPDTIIFCEFENATTEGAGPSESVDFVFREPWGDRNPNRILAEKIAEVYRSL